MRHLALLALLVSLPLSSRACINDRDSDALAIQNKRLPDAIRVIAGRFERNPPRYYQMRIARVEGELKRSPRPFALYDDLAVAHDRLGDDETAMRVMAQKRSLLPAYSPNDKALKEAWYRYFANDGTFRAHRFLHDGAKVQNIADMKRARAEISRALEIKPNAHFGREKYQLAVMDWIIACKINKAKDSLAAFLEHRFSWPEEDYFRKNQPLAKQRQEAAEGLSGLIVLGAAWQSPDVFDALGGALQSQPTIALSHLARKRCDEIQSSGVASHGSQPIGSLEAEGIEREAGLNFKNKETLDALYPRLRAEGDEWIRQRDRWMETKFAQGKHPDTDQNFWQGWEEPPANDLNEVKWWNQGKGHYEDNPTPLSKTLLSLAPLFAALCLSWWAIKRKWYGRRKTSPA